MVCLNSDQTHCRFVCNTYYDMKSLPHNICATMTASVMNPTPYHWNDIDEVVQEIMDVDPVLCPDNSCTRLSYSTTTAMICFIFGIM